MCGIAGVIGIPSGLQRWLDVACRSLRHRGPDHAAIWIDYLAGIGLGHTRLSILDLSPAGHQPMASACGRYIMVFNGEIYNHLDLRSKLEQIQPHRWRGHSDTETLLSCISLWGFEKALQATVGMFALGVWDRHERKLLLARDRLGEKPLYYGFVESSFFFASELKAFAQLPGCRRSIDSGALASFMRYNYIPAPRTIYKNVLKLVPGTWIELSPEDAQQGNLAKPREYWSALEQARTGSCKPAHFATELEAREELEDLLKRSIAGQMVADVPLGAFLSGGIDSSTVVSLMQAQSMRCVKTFSIGFHLAAYDEAKHAKVIAQHLGTDHTELYLSAEDAQSVIPQLASIYDEPFADSSQIPTYLVARLARAHVVVSLSGDGGDELFGGYNRYSVAARAWRYLRRIPKKIRWLMAKAILTPSPKSWDHLYAAIAPFVPARRRLVRPGDFLHKSAQLLDAQNGMALYGRLVSHWQPECVVLCEPEPIMQIPREESFFPGLVETMMALDAVTYLPDDILVKVDRAAMAVSLETRVPLLDHRIFEFAWRLPMQYKIRGRTGKWLLRQVLHRYVPTSLFERPKMGFSVPIGAWLRGALRPWAEDLLNEGTLKRQGYLDPQPIRSKWHEHLTGRRNWEHHLWDVLMFQSWLQASSRV